MAGICIIRNHGIGDVQVRQHTAESPRCIVIAGPNGAGKTTFAREYLPREGGIIHFVNADLIASGLSPLRPDLAARQAGRLVLQELSRLANERKDFAFESTLSGRSYLRLLNQWKQEEYQIEIVFLRLASVDIALRRIAARVRQGGHDVPRGDVIRRFNRSWNNFLTVYCPIADAWAVYDNSGDAPLLLEGSP
ncbi:MAG: zeta toxin family protein [Nitrospira sp.]